MDVIFVRKLFKICSLMRHDIALPTDKSFHHIVVVVQPLKSLMKNQLNKLCGLGLKATYIGDEEDREELEANLISGKYNYIILSPESATSPWFLNILLQIRKKIACLFIDESHCVKTL